MEEDEKESFINSMIKLGRVFFKRKCCPHCGHNKLKCKTKSDRFFCTKCKREDKGFESFKNKNLKICWRAKI